MTVSADWELCRVVRRAHELGRRSAFVSSTPPRVGDGPTNRSRTRCYRKSERAARNAQSITRACFRLYPAQTRTWPFDTSICIISGLSDSRADPLPCSLAASLDISACRDPRLWVPTELGDRHAQDVHHNGRSQVGARTGASNLFSSPSHTSRRRCSSFQTQRLVRRLTQCLDLRRGRTRPRLRFKQRETRRGVVRTSSTVRTRLSWT